MTKTISEYLPLDASQHTFEQGTPKKESRKTLMGYWTRSVETAGGANRGPMMELGGYLIFGVLTPLSTGYKELFIALDDDVTNQGSYVGDCGLSKTINRKLGHVGVNNLVEEKISANMDIEDFPIERVMIFELDSGVVQTSPNTYTIEEMLLNQYNALNPSDSSTVNMTTLYSHTITGDDIVEFYGQTQNENRVNLNLPGKNFLFVQDARYCVQLVLRNSFLRRAYGIGTRPEMEESPSFMPSLLSTSVTEAKAFMSRENEVSVVVKYKNVPVDLLYFDRFELHGFAPAPLDSDVHDFFRYGYEDGEVILHLNGRATTTGEKETILIGYNQTDRQDGVVLWHPDISKSQLKITVTDT